MVKERNMISEERLLKLEEKVALFISPDREEFYADEWSDALDIFKVMPDLIAEIRRLRSENARLEKYEALYVGLREDRRRLLDMLRDTHTTLDTLSRNAQVRCQLVYEVIEQSVVDYNKETSEKGANDGQAVKG